MCLFNSKKNENMTIFVWKLKGFNAINQIILSVLAKKMRLEELYCFFDGQEMGCKKQYKGFILQSSSGKVPFDRNNMCQWNWQQ